MPPTRITWIDDHFIDPWCEWWIDPPRCLVIGPSKRGRGVMHRPEPKSEDEIIYELMLKAIADPIQKQKELETQRHEATLRIRAEGMRRDIERQLNPPETQMPEEVREYFKVKQVENKVNQRVRQAAEQEEFSKDIAMRLKMAKVRAAKRNRRGNGKA